MKTLADILARAAASPHAVNFIDARGNEERVPYVALAERARAAAAMLRKRGVEPHERVGIILPTCVGFFDAFFGCIIVGAVPVPLYPPTRLGRLDEYHERTAQMLRAVDAKLVITDSRAGKVIGDTMLAAQPVRGWLDVRDLTRDMVAAMRPTLAEDDVAFVQFSSGTTGAPKPIVLTHRQILSNVTAILGAIDEAYPLAAPERHSCVSWLPLYHDMGLIGCVLAALAYPGELTLLGPETFITEPVRWLRTISEKRATISAAPSFAYSLCLERIDDAALVGVNLSSWRVALNGAEPVAPAVMTRFGERFSRRGLRPETLTPVYGLAEATLAVTFSDLKSRWSMQRFDTQKLAGEGVATPAPDGTQLVSLGKPLPSVELRIADDEGKAAADSTLGRIEIRGPSVTHGYLGEPPRAADAWLDTGDTGFIHGGELFVYGRTKDIIVIRGRKYAPHDIEHAVSGVAGVRSGCVAAVGITGAEGEELHLFVEHARGQTVDEAAVRDAVGSATGFTELRIVVLEPGTLPRTSSGKISRSEAARRFRAGTLTPPTPVSMFKLGITALRSKLAMVKTRSGA
ncbi:MAG: fatty acyl-AMP ligase [Myxococcota bacterium]